MPATDRLHGTLDALVLKSLTTGPRHGFGILRWIAEQTDDAVRVEEGSLYPGLYRMERDGWIEAEWGATEQGRRAKFYAITGEGRRQLVAETRELASFIAAITPVLLPAPAAR
jgi:PadR family transcriptional regulator